jgi:glucuronosyltransferase
MPIDMKNAFISAFAKIPQTVIWRLEGDTSEARKVPNIRIADWLPQKDLLGHPKVKAFITHGGYNSLTEATYLGVPLIMFPLFGDQHANVKRVERLNVGVTLLRKNLSETSILEALNTVLNSETIQGNAKRLGQMIRNKPESSQDLAVKWVEFLAEFQDLDQLKPASIDLNLMQYFLIDVYFTLFFSFLLIMFVIFKCCKFGVKKICCRGRKQKSE